jgi:hypothetical protein
MIPPAYGEFAEVAPSRLAVIDDLEQPAVTVAVDIAGC